MTSFERIIEKYRNTKFTKDQFIYVDSEGEIYRSPEEAFKTGKIVKVTKESEMVLAELNEAGINDDSDVKVLMNILKFIGGDLKTTRKRVTYSDKDKKSIVKEWVAAEKSGTGKNEFVKEKNVSYTTLNKWIKKFT